MEVETEGENTAMVLTILFPEKKMVKKNSFSIKEEKKKKKPAVS